MALDSEPFPKVARKSISDSESELDLDNEPFLHSPNPPEKIRYLRSISLLYLCIIVPTTAFLYFTILGVPWDGAVVLDPAEGQSDSCRSPVLRREWRSLSLSERHDYLTAVRCLGGQPSRLGLNHSLYDDFPWVHSRMGNFCKLAF